MTPPAFALELFGGFRLVAHGRPVTRAFTTRQQQLLAYLALHHDAPVPRQQIAGRFWPDSTDAQALTNLRREWHHLRDTWPDADRIVDAGSRTFGLRPALAGHIDVHEFERAAARGLDGDRTALETAAGLYRGDILPDCGDEWILPHRERLRGQAVRALTRLVELLEQERAFSDAITSAQQLLQLDPLLEPAWCTLMRCHARRGERAAALHLYQRCAALLKQELDVQPSAATRMTYREILDLDETAAGPPAAPPRTMVYPLIGRQIEWAAMLRAWEAAAAGRQQLVLVRGEAGIGKTRLAEELVEWCRARSVRVAVTRCYAGDGALAYAPIAAWLQGDAVRQALASLDAVWLTDVARLHPEVLVEREDVPNPTPHLEAWQRTRFFEALARVFHTATPLLLVLDDVQWADADTLEWLHFFLRAPDTRCLVVGTLRSEEENDNRALGVLVAELERLDRVTAVPLGPLDEASTARLASEVAEQPLDAGQVARTYRQTEGHPLFIIEQGRMDETVAPGGTALSPRVQSVVAARLAKLSDDARAVAEIAAAIGRDFTFDVVAQVSDLEEDAVVRAVDELWRRQIVRVQPGERWDFSHDRIREVAYGAIGPARSRLIHRRIAQALERTFAADLDPASAAIATHLERGGQPLRAMPFLERAAAVAVRMSAHEDAIRWLTEALRLVELMPAGRDRDEREVSLRTLMSGSLTWARGYAAPVVEENIQRVIAVSRALGGGGEPVRWLWALCMVHFMHGELTSARQVSELALRGSAGDPSSRCEAHHAMAGTLMSVGELAPSREHFAAAIAAHDERVPQLSALGSDLGVFASAWYAHTLWLVGDANTAAVQAESAIALAHRRDHVYSETLALAYAALTHQLRRDTGRVAECAQAVVARCERHAFAYYGDWARVLLGWVRGQEGRPLEGVAMIDQAIARLDAQRAHARRPYYWSLLAETLVAAGERARAVTVLDTAIATALARGDVWWLPELYRQKADLDALARVSMLTRALEIAQAQGSRSLETRIRASLAGT